MRSSSGAMLDRSGPIVIFMRVFLLAGVLRMGRQRRRRTRPSWGELPAGALRRSMRSRSAASRSSVLRTTLAGPLEQLDIEVLGLTHRAVQLKLPSDPPLPGLAQMRGQLAILEQHADRVGQGCRAARRHQEAGFPVLDPLADAPDARRA